MSNIQKKTYEIDVWYRIVTVTNGGKQRVEYTTVSIVAQGLDEALKKLKKVYGEKYKPIPENFKSKHQAL